MKKYKDFINENQRWKDILKPKPLDKVLQDLEKSGYTPQEKFEFAYENGILPLVKELLKDERVDPSNYNNYAIRFASENGHVEVVRELLKDDRVNPSDSRNYAIGWASHNGHLEVVKELLKDERVDPSNYNNVAIGWASGKGHVEVVKELLKDDRVRNSLSKEDLEKYENQVKSLNENNKIFENQDINIAIDGDDNGLVDELIDRLSIFYKKRKDRYLKPTKIVGVFGDSIKIRINLSNKDDINIEFMNDELKIKINKKLVYHMDQIPKNEIINKVIKYYEKYLSNKKFKIINKKNPF